MTDTPEESGEDRLIARYFKPLATHPAAFGLVDDAAALTPPLGCDLVLKTDAIVGGIHFFPDDPPGLIAQKALRVNLSDLAAKGAKPLGFLLSIALPASVEEAWLAGFSAGLAEDVKRFACPLLGGDTVRSPAAMMISVAAIGVVPMGGMVRRSGAEVGDRIVVTGTIGDAALGLRLRTDAAGSARWRLSSSQQHHLRQRYLQPEPRIAIADMLRAHATAAMDVSDGLAGDLAKLCRASGISAIIDAERVPLSDAASAALVADEQLIEPIFTGGDDYEILATVPPARLESVRAAAATAGVALTEIGTVTAGGTAPRFLLHGQPLKFKRSSFSHF